jgi:hypothetical protein
MTLRSLPKHILYEIAYYLPDDINFAKCFDLDSITYEGNCNLFIKEKNLYCNRRKLRRYTCKNAYCMHCNDVMCNLDLSKLEYLQIRRLYHYKIKLPKTLNTLILNGDDSYIDDIDYLQLKRLEVGFCAIDSLEFLINQYSLKSLRIWKFSGDLSPLQKLPSLEKLYLGTYNKSLESLKCPLLKKLTLYEFDGDLKPLQNLSSLEKLTLNSYNGSLKCLQTIKTLKKLNLGNSEAKLDSLCDSYIECIKFGRMPNNLYKLRGCKHLKKIDFTKCFYLVCDLDILRHFEGLDIVVVHKSYKIYMKTKTFIFEKKPTYCRLHAEFYDEDKESKDEDD